MPSHVRGAAPSVCASGGSPLPGAVGLLCWLLWTGCGGGAPSQEDRVGEEGGRRRAERPASTDSLAVEGAAPQPLRSPPMPVETQGLGELEAFLTEYRGLVEQYCAYAYRYSSASPQELAGIVRDLAPLTRRLGEYTEQARRMQPTLPPATREGMDSLHARAVVCAEKLGEPSAGLPG